MARAINNAIIRRNWLSLLFQKRRRARAAGEALPPPPPIPRIPVNLSGEAVDGVFVALAWDLTGDADGYSIEARIMSPGQEFSEKGTTGPGENTFQFDGSSFWGWQCRIRAFNASGYSGYSEIIEVDL